MTDESSWTAYYANLGASGPSWLDYSNQTLQVQTLGLAIGAAGAIEGKSCLDAGCGNGQLALALQAFRPQGLTAIDIVASFTEAIARRIPGIASYCGDVSDADFVKRLGTHDLVFCIELLQYVPHRQTLRLLWNCVAPGGRLIAIAPNAACPIARRVEERFGGRFRPIEICELGSIAAQLPCTSVAAWRSLSFASDQRIESFEVGPWLEDFGAVSGANRIQLVFVKAREATSSNGEPSPPPSRSAGFSAKL